MLPAAGALLIGLPGFVLAVWFSKLVRRRWLHGGAISVALAWLTTLIAIAGLVTALGFAVIHTGHGLLYNACSLFAILTIAGGIPSVVIALVVSLLTSRVPEKAELIVVIGTIAGLVTSLIGLKLALAAMDALWR